jgi:hypothetical protein
MAKWRQLDKQERLKLKTDIESAPALPSKQWLLSQMQ